MKLFINKNKKDSIHKQIAKKMKSVRIIVLISKILMFVGLGVGILYLIFNFASPSLSMVNVNGVLKKDVSFIIITSSFIFAPCIIFSVCLNVLAKNIAGVNSFSRVDEDLQIDGEGITYSFRFKHQSNSSERTVIKMKFASISSLEYDDDTQKFRFSGDLLKEEYDDFRTMTPIDVNHIGEFVLHDYFSPEIKEVLISNGIMVEDTNGSM